MKASTSKLRDYYRLAKPGIIYGNLMYALAGLLFASHWKVSAELLLGTMLGIGLIIGSACVFNNYIDRGIDAKMARTEKRALVTGKISVISALTYGAVLGVLGFTILALTTNWLTVLIGAIGFVDYIVFYGWSKRNSEYSTLIGGVSGAMPLVAGYTAVTGQFDATALLLFIILVCWQMPHFYAISLYRRKDYKSAELPVMSVKRGVASTKKQIIFFTAAFLVASLSLSIVADTGLIYFIVMMLVGGWWFILAVKGLRQKEYEKWAKQIFFFSLVITIVLSVSLALSPLIHI